MLEALLLAIGFAQQIDGQVLHDASGAPLPSAEVRVHRPGQPELAAHLETNAQGRFQAEGLPAGEYTVEVAKPNGTAELKLEPVTLD